MAVEVARMEVARMEVARMEVARVEVVRVEVARVEVARGGRPERARAPSPSHRAWRQVASRTWRSTCRSLSAQCNEEGGSAGGRAAGCVAGQARRSVSMQGGCSSARARA